MLIMALVINIIIIVFEMFIFIKLKDKRDVFKYYTFLQNFIALDWYNICYFCNYEFIF